jgi:hypothetical protein
MKPDALATIDPGGAVDRKSADGYGIVFAVLGTGIQGSHPHFRRYENLELPAPLRHRDFTLVGSGRQPDEALLAEEALIDLNGFSTHVAGIVAGYGDVTDKTVRWGLDDPPTGIAPRCKLLSLKVLDDKGSGSESTVLLALEYVASLNAGAPTPRVHGVLVPLGFEFDMGNYACGHSPLCVAVDRLVATGVVVVVPAGNRGDHGLMTITDPGNAERAITVGATNTKLPHTYGPTYFSSRGPTADGRSKPDFLAPGWKILSAIPPEEEPQPKRKSKGKAKTARLPLASYDTRDGTSMSAAVTAGAVASLLSVRKDLIGRPDEVKKLLLECATDLARDRYCQGRGLLNLSKALGADATFAEPEKRAATPEAIPQTPIGIEVGTASPPKEAKEGQRFAVAFSFAGEQRPYILRVREALRQLGRLSRASILYDMQFQAELDRVNLDTYLQELYFKSEIIVAFLSADYARKEWTQLEGRAIREMIKRRDTDRLMFVRFDDAEVPGLFSIDGYISARENDPPAVADLILDRLYAERERG